MHISFEKIDRHNLSAFQNYLLPDALISLQAADSAAYAVGAVIDQKNTCGAIAGILLDDTQHGLRILMINSLFVDAPVRGQQLGLGLLSALTDAVDFDEIMVHWELPAAESDRLRSYFQEIGFEIKEEEKKIYRLETRAMRNRTIIRRAFQPGFKADPNILPIRDCTEQELQELLADPDIPQALSIARFDPAVLRTDLCLGYRYVGQIQAYFLAEKTSADNYAILAAVTRKDANPAAFLQLVTTAIHNSLSGLVSGEACYWLEAINATAEKLALSLGGDSIQNWKLCTGLFDSEKDVPADRTLTDQETS